MIVLNKSAGQDEQQTRKLAEEILAKLNEGKSFAEMARMYSQGNQRNQGVRDWEEVDSLRKELAEPASKLKAGEHSGVIETPDACYLLCVEDKRPSHYKSLGDVRGEIEKNLVLEERSRLEQQWIERLKKKTFVKRTFY
jgi:parvulin-like peptidyl-prolyl isomerase